MQCVRPALHMCAGPWVSVGPPCCARAPSSQKFGGSSLDAIGHDCSRSSMFFELCWIRAAALEVFDEKLQARRFTAPFSGC
eukprot:9479249-Pyramimonas_sp.AAC.1